LRAKQLIESEHTHEAYRSKLAEVYAYVLAQDRTALCASPAD
jgi:hypothetical protein